MQRFKLFLLFNLHLMLVTALLAQVDTAWVRRYNGTGNQDDKASAIAVDDSGSVYVTGTVYSSDTTYGDYATIKYNSQGIQQWIQIYNGLGSGDDRGSAIAVDDSGNVYVTGSSDRSAGTNQDYATIKYNSQGVQQWVATYNGPANGRDYASAIAVDDSGNVYVTGTSYGGYTNEDDYATIKYNSQGVQQWVARYNGPDNWYDNARAIAVDDSGNVYVTGNSAGSGTSQDYATIKYNAQGNIEWVARYNGPDNLEDYATAIAIDGSRNVYVTGYSKSSSTWFDYVTIKYNSQGNPEWLARYTGPGYLEDYAYALTIDGSGNVYVTGCSHGGSNTNLDYATIKYNSLGVQEWVARYNGPDNREDYAKAIAIDGSGNVYVTGYSFDTLGDYATIKYSNSGEQRWIARYNGPGNGEDCANRIAVDGSGNVYVTGYSKGYGTYDDYCTIKYVQGLVHDVKTVRILAPVGGVRLDTVITPQAEVKNVGNFTENFPVIFRIGTFYDETLFVNLEPNATTILSFPNWIANPIGHHIVKCSTALSNDNYPDNDAVMGSVSVVIDTGPVITRITPNYGGNIGNVRVDIIGRRFCRDSLQKTIVRLVRIGQPSLTAYTEVIDSTKIIAEFDLTGAEVGFWNVVVINPNGDSTICYDGFRILPGYEGLWMDFVGNDRIRIGRYDYYTVWVGNAGNVDAYGLAINIDMPAELQITRITRGDGVTIWDRNTIINNHQIGQNLYPEYWLGAPPGITSSVLRYGDVLWLPFLGRGQTVSFTMTVFAPESLKDGQDLAPAVAILIGLGTAVGTSFVQHFIAQTIGARFGPDETRLPWLKALGRSFVRACAMTWEDWNPLNWFNWSTSAAQEFFGQVVDEDKPLAKIFQRYGMSAAKATETAEKLAEAGKNLKLAKINPILNLVLFGAQTSLESYEKLQY
ncbi:MAG: SBBP repeat-containing protein, partial [candidate division WOR-3 bacterium]